jgi:ABC-type sugar transport system ATPase subunit
MLHVKEVTIYAGTFAVNSASFHIKKGEYYFLLGESGSGKSLLLEAISGTRNIQKGNIIIDGEDITNQPLNKRNVGIVFQNLALFPHKKVFKNIAFSLNCRKLGKKEIDFKVHQMAEKLGISKLLQRYPETLSGGEHQRVALARTLIMKPAILLLDEPLSSLDILLKEEMVALLKEIHQQGQTILHVTHDYHEVAQLADRISIIENGQILQTGTRLEISKAPRNRLAHRISNPFV